MVSTVVIVNESPASHFYEQMRVREVALCGEWVEINLEAESYHEDILLSCLSFEDFRDASQRYFFYEATQNCIRELRRQVVMELS